MIFLHSISSCRWCSSPTRWGLLKANCDQRSSSLRWRTSSPSCSCRCRLVTWVTSPVVVSPNYFQCLSCILVCVAGVCSQRSRHVQETSDGNVESLVRAGQPCSEVTTPRIQCLLKHYEHSVRIQLSHRSRLSALSGGIIH